MPRCYETRYSLDFVLCAEKINEIRPFLVVIKLAPRWLALQSASYIILVSTQVIQTTTLVPQMQLRPRTQWLSIGLSNFESSSFDLDDCSSSWHVHRRCRHKTTFGVYTASCDRELSRPFHSHEYFKQITTDEFVKDVCPARIWLFN